MAAVVEVLQEAEGRIRIEDVLPLFPDFVTIDAFKAAICASLEDYNSQIERLKFEMADATRMADALRCVSFPVCTFLLYKQYEVGLHAHGMLRSTADVKASV